jgi:hypothetical protein
VVRRGKKEGGWIIPEKKMNETDKKRKEGTVKRSKRSD